MANSETSLGIYLKYPAENMLVFVAAASNNIYYTGNSYFYIIKCFKFDWNTIVVYTWNSFIWTADWSEFSVSDTCHTEVAVLQLLAEMFRPEQNSNYY